MHRHAPGVEPRAPAVKLPAGSRSRALVRAPSSAMARPVTVLASLALVVGLAAITNPSAERHREKLKEGVAERSPIAGALGLGSVAGWVSVYHSAVVGSWTTVGDRTVTVGAFGMVFVLG